MKRFISFLAGFAIVTAILAPSIKAQNIANGTVTAAVITGGLTASGSAANDFSASTGTFLTSTGANTLSGATTIADATTPSLTLASGKTNTGFVQINGKTSGALKLIAADAAVNTVTVSLAIQSVGNATLTIPDQAGTGRNLVTDTGTATLTGKTLTAPSMTSPVITSTTNQLVLGTTNTTTINAAAPSSSITLNFPSAASAAMPFAANCGATGTGNQTCTNGSATAGTYHFISGHSTLSSGSAIITFPAGFVFAGTGSFECTTGDVTTTANPSKMVPSAANTATISGTTSDVITWICAGF